MTDAVPPPRTIAIEAFLPLVGQLLQAACDPRPMALELISATPLINHAKLARPPFILMLRSAPNAILVTGTYVLCGHGFGPDQVHLAQIAAPAGLPPGHYYQAVFN
jgi:hypothetical protein